MQWNENGSWIQETTFKFKLHHIANVYMLAKAFNLSESYIPYWINEDCNNFCPVDFMVLLWGSRWNDMM